MTVDNGENVVEIVGNPRGKLTDGFHFLRVAQLAIGPDAFMSFAAQLAIDRLELDRALVRHLGQVFEFQLCLPIELPLASERVRELHDLDIIERLF